MRWGRRIQIKWEEEFRPNKKRRKILNQIYVIRGGSIQIKW
jgi:hypothetical protein